MLFSRIFEDLLSRVFNSVGMFCSALRLSHSAFVSGRRYCHLFTPPASNNSILFLSFHLLTSIYSSLNRLFLDWAAGPEAHIWWKRKSQLRRWTFWPSSDELIGTLVVKSVAELLLFVSFLLLCFSVLSNRYVSPLQHTGLKRALLWW